MSPSVDGRNIYLLGHSDIIIGLNNWDLQYLKRGLKVLRSNQTLRHLKTIVALPKGEIEVEIEKELMFIGKGHNWNSWYKAI